MKAFFRPLVFLFAAAAVLLLADLRNRTGSRKDTGIYRIAVLRFNSNQILEETEDGLLKGLYQMEGYKKGNIKIKRYCPEGDMPTANTIVRSIVGDKFNMVVSISTPGLQVMANGNKDGTVLHVFCAVTDPESAGVGITGPGADEHPKHLVGIGSFQPVEEVFRIARQMKPDLKKVGVVWCTSESCSEACVRKARLICKELGIELLEKSIENVSHVYEAAQSLCMSQVEALWIGGDNVVEPAIGVYASVGMKNGIPIFTNNPKHTLKGAMLSLGANYYQVGYAAALLVDTLIKGYPPSRVKINNLVPERLFINDSVRKLMKAEWNLPESILSRTDSIIR
jgi:putative tryptophan/tyrosine transport system substrate-binding protein